MNNANHGGEFHVDKLDADAVCAQCNTVNTEGTLLCKVCGNNLRDQRNRRMQADQAMDLEHTGQRRRAWLSGVFFVLALVLIASTLMNQELIVEWLIEEEVPPTGLLWTGQYDAYFRPMFEEIEAAGLTPESAAALQVATPSDTLEGVYALFDGDTFLGTASFRIEGEDAYFAAMLENEREVRGIARLEANNYIALPDFSGIDHRGGVTPISGVAIPQEDGAVECMGDDGRERSSFMAYRLPDQ
jgi:hypothetical protein